MQPTTVEFLRQLLADEGYKVAAVFEGGKVKHTFFQDVETLANFIISADSRGDTVYHACATYVDTSSRKQSNVTKVKALWLDIDAGEGKPYADFQAAYAALLVFCEAAGLPWPTTVCSGNGLHAYWFLSTAIGLQAWSRYATGLKAAAVKHGLQSDPTRTADAASILRSPGTTNRKGKTPLPVTIGEIQPPCELEDLSSLLTYAPVLAGAPSRVHKVSANTPRLMAAAMNIYSERATYAEPIIAQCKQINEIVRLRGNVVEPLWYAGLGIAGRCIGGDQLVHQWSDGHPNYSVAETDAKTARALALSGPTTCAHFASLNAEGCKGCPFAGKITTPFELGRDAPVAPPPSLETAPDKEPLPSLPEGFAWGLRGELVMESERDGRPSNVVISKQSLYLHALQTAEVRANYYSAHFRHLRPHDGWQDIDVTVSKLTGSQVAAEMGQRGVIIHNASAFQKYVRDAIDQHIATRKAAMRYEQMGWKDNDTAFLWGNRLYRGTSIETVAASDDIVTRTERYGLGPTPNGNLIQWRAAVDTLFGIGAEALGFGFLAGFGAPLMHFHRAEEGGCLISLVSQGSGKGKSTAIDAATSIWGPRRIALEMTKFDTRASQAILLASICHLPVVFDELQDKDPGYITDTAYLFSQGRDKQRATRDGDLRHVASEWRTIMVSTSNRSVVEAIKGMDSAIDAPAYRVLEFDVPEVVKILPKHEALKAAMRDNAGHAGHEYLQYITHPDIVAWLRVEVPAEAVRINQQLNLRPEHRFWARSLAAIAIASEIVSTLGLVTFTPSRIMQWAFERVKEVIVEDAVPKKGASTRAVAVLAEYINGHTNSILVMPGPYQAGISEPATRTPTNQLYIRYEIKGRRIIIAAKPFRRWLAKRDINHRALYTELKIENLLLDQRHITLSAGSSLPSVQEMSLIVDGNNPAISGTLADVSSFGFEVKGSGPKPAALRLRL